MCASGVGLSVLSDPHPGALAFALWCGAEKCNTELGLVQPAALSGWCSMCSSLRRRWFKVACLVASGLPGAFASLPIGPGRNLTCRTNAAVWFAVTGCCWESCFLSANLQDLCLSQRFFESKSCELCAGSSNSCELCEGQLQDVEVRHCRSGVWQFHLSWLCWWWCCIEGFLLSSERGLVPSLTTSEAATASVCLRCRVTADPNPPKLTLAS